MSDTVSTLMIVSAIYIAASLSGDGFGRLICGVLGVAAVLISFFVPGVVE